jgi:O-antigen/teichoic acid export membrane protein
MPVLTHYLSPTDYGIIALFNTYTSLLIPFLGFVSSGLISIEYFNKANSDEDFQSIYSSVLSIPIIPAIVFTIIGYSFRQWLGPLLNLPFEYLWLLPVLAILTFYYQHMLNFLAITKKPITYASSNILKVILEVSLTLIFIIILSMDWKGRVYSWLLAIILFFVFSLIYSAHFKYLTLKIKWEHIRAGLIFGSPLILHTIGKIVVNQSDRIFITKMVSVNEMGIYNTGYLVGSILMIISSAFINVYNPYLYERMANITQKKKYEILRISYGFILILLILLGIITFLTPYFYQFLINEKFAGGSKYVFWVGLSYLFWGGYLVFSGIIFYLKKTHILAYLAIINVVLNLSLNYWFILIFGAIGAAYATVVSFFVIFVLVAFFSNRIYPMPWFDLKEILKI